MKCFACLLILLGSSAPLTAQSVFSAQQKETMEQKVAAAAAHAWEGYKTYALGADELRPLTKQSRTWYKQSMLLTPVDAFDTFVLLGMNEQAGEAKDLILTKLNFNVDQEVQVFETTIRLVGGLISAYELDGDPRFLTLAEDIGRRLMPAFNTPTGMPYRFVNLVTGKIRDSINNPAEIGTLLLEFGKLSQLTHNPSYYKAAKKAILEVYARRSPIGLVGENINVNTGKWTSTQSHISGYIDSYYEYLYKGWKLFGDKDIKRAWDSSFTAITKYLLVVTPNGTFCTHVDMYTGKESAPLYGALDAFIAGLFAYAGDIPIARKMQQGNFYMWKKFNLEPEEFNFRTGALTDSSYSLRPENIESCYYLYTLTKDQQYLGMGKRMVDDILNHCRTNVAFASLKNIITFEQRNSMESFFFAETLKYAGLLFAQESKIDLRKVVFNTEAHPLKINLQEK